MRNLTKKSYVDSTFKIIRDEGLENIGIRRISKELGVSSTSLYRHFDSLDHLMIYVSLKYLTPYIKSLEELDSDILSTPEGYFEMWEQFARYSFESPKMFNNIFYSDREYPLGPIFKEYYDIYIDEIADVDPSIKQWVTSDDFVRRSIQSMTHSLSGYDVPAQVIEDICNIHVCLYTGMFKTLLETGAAGDEVQRFIRYIKQVFMSMSKVDIRL